jgi:hypothetical protein
MINAELLPAVVLNRKAVVYVRQSTQTQVQMNLESQRRQYDLVGEARRLGFRDIEVIDDDLGRSASGTVARPGVQVSLPLSTLLFARPFAVGTTRFCCGCTLFHSFSSSEVNRDRYVALFIVFDREVELRLAAHSEDGLFATDVRELRKLHLLVSQTQFQRPDCRPSADMHSQPWIFPPVRSGCRSSGVSCRISV